MGSFLSDLLTAMSWAKHRPDRAWPRGQALRVERTMKPGDSDAPFALNPLRLVLSHTAAVRFMESSHLLPHMRSDREPVFSLAPIGGEGWGDGADVAIGESAGL